MDVCNHDSCSQISVAVIFPVLRSENVCSKKKLGAFGEREDDRKNIMKRKILQISNALVKDLRKTMGAFHLLELADQTGQFVNGMCRFEG